MTTSRNLITDVAGLLVGNAHDPKLASGVTAIVFDEPAVAAVDIRGGGPGSRDTELLDPAMTVERIDAIALSGGSAFGLDAASGVQAWMREQGRGFAIGPARVPIVPGAVLFDLNNGGDKNWGKFPPYRELGYAAAQAAGVEFRLGTAGAGFGATTVNLKGGLGAASARTSGGITVGALVAVNAVGSVTVGDGPWFWAAPFEQDAEFGGRGFPATLPPEALHFRSKGQAGASTTIALVATDALLGKPQARRLAVMAQDGLARAIYPVHTPLDGDTVFAAATGRLPLADPVFALAELGTIAANVLARAVARGVYEATTLPYRDALLSWCERFPGQPAPATHPAPKLPPISDLDDLVLSAATPRWLKVARIVSDVLRDIGKMGFNADDPGVSHAVAERIKALILSGELQNRGNVSLWRYSEVRLADRSDD